MNFFLLCSTDSVQHYMHHVLNCPSGLSHLGFEHAGESWALDYFKNLHKNCFVESFSLLLSCRTENHMKKIKQRTWFLVLIPQRLSPDGLSNRCILCLPRQFAHDHECFCCASCCNSLCNWYSEILHGCHLIQECDCSPIFHLKFFWAKRNDSLWDWEENPFGVFLDNYGHGSWTENP